MNTNQSSGAAHRPASPGEATSEHEPSRDRPTSPGVPTAEHPVPNRATP